MHGRFRPLVALVVGTGALARPRCAARLPDAQPASIRTP